jgi:hypothetical protein
MPGMASYLYVDRFRGFSDALVELKRVNFLVGENSTGKSSLLELLATLMDRDYWLFEPLYGSGKSRRHFLDLVSAGDPNKTCFTVGGISATTNRESNIGLLVTYTNIGGMPVAERVSTLDGMSVSTVGGRLVAKSSMFRRTRVQLPSNSVSPHADAKSFVELHRGWTAGGDEEQSERGGPLFIRLEQALFKGDLPERLHRLGESFFGKDLIVLAPIRTEPKRTYDAPHTSYSAAGEHTPYVLKKWIASKTFKDYVESAGENSGLFKSLGVRSYGDEEGAPFELRVLLGTTDLRIDNVGYGVSQALPLLVEMFVRQDFSAFSIQQPEVHVHPRAQAAMGDVIGDLSRSEGKLFFVETHSDHLIDRFRLNIRRKGALESQLLFFERVGGGNRVTPIAITEGGDLSTEQPDAYRSFFVRESMDLLG